MSVTKRAVTVGCVSFRHVVKITIVGALAFNIAPTSLAFDYLATFLSVEYSGPSILTVGQIGTFTARIVSPVHAIEGPYPCGDDTCVKEYINYGFSDGSFFPDNGLARLTESASYGLEEMQFSTSYQSVGNYSPSALLDLHMKEARSCLNGPGGGKCLEASLWNEDAHYSIGPLNHTWQLKVVPVPEPSTYAMLLAGLGLLGFAARRRKQAT